MGYPNPLAVRAVRETLEQGLREAGMVGAASVVTALVGTMWGKLFSASNNRDYLNFLGELAKRSITGEQVKLASKIDAYSRVKTGYDGKAVIATPARRRDGVAINNDGSPRNNGHTYDSYDLRNAENHLTTQYRFPKTSRALQDVDRDHHRNYNKKGNFSVLMEAVDEMCTISHDFSISTFFQTIKNKLSSLFNSGRRDTDIGKDVLLGCYEFLEDHGYEAYPILVDILNRQGTAGNFSITVDTILNSEEDMKRAAATFERLSDAEKDSFYNALQVSCGEESADLFMDSIAQYKSGVQPKSFIVGLLEHLGVTLAAIGIMNFLFNKRAEKNRQKYT